MSVFKVKHKLGGQPGNMVSRAQLKEKPWLFAEKEKNNNTAIKAGSFEKVSLIVCVS
jgi:hypothetical protein